MDETIILADYVANANYEDLPAEVIERARESLFDTIACGLGGRKTKEGDILINIMKEIGGKPEATVLGEKTKLSFMQAAQANRVLTNMLDYDDTSMKAGHMSTVLIPTALAMAERYNASGKDVINAVVLAYEVISRIRDAVQPSESAYWKTFQKFDSGMHFGATVVACKLLDLNRDQISDAFGLTGLVRPSRITMPNRAKNGMPPWMKVTGGDIAIPGIHSAFLGREGFQGDRTILDQGSGYEISVGSDRYDGTKLIADLGREYKTLKIGYKFYSACRHTSSSLDAVAAIISENNIKPQEVDRVKIGVQKHTAENFAIYEPHHMIQAQFSLPYVVAMVLMGEPTGPNWYRDDMLNNPQAKTLQRKAELYEDKEATALFYSEQKSHSTVEITTTDKRRFNKFIEYPKGEPENPFSRQDHIDKLTNMALWLAMKQSQINELITALDRFEELKNIKELTKLLVV